VRHVRLDHFCPHCFKEFFSQEDKGTHIDFCRDAPDDGRLFGTVYIFGDKCEHICLCRIERMQGCMGSSR